MGDDIKPTTPMPGVIPSPVADPADIPAADMPLEPVVPGVPAATDMPAEPETPAVPGDSSLPTEVPAGEPGEVPVKPAV